LLPLHCKPLLSIWDPVLSRLLQMVHNASSGGLEILVSETVNAGTSTIKLTYAGALQKDVWGGNKTYYNFWHALALVQGAQYCL